VLRHLPPRERASHSEQEQVQVCPRLDGLVPLILRIQLIEQSVSTAPLADHHAHLRSPASAKLVNDPPLPTIELPADLARLLGEREKGWNDKAALTRLLTEDSLVLVKAKIGERAERSLVTP
jgi:hypothetical protein